MKKDLWIPAIDIHVYGYNYVSIVQNGSDLIRKGYDISSIYKQTQGREDIENTTVNIGRLIYIQSLHDRVYTYNSTVLYWALDTIFPVKQRLAEKLSVQSYVYPKKDSWSSFLSSDVFREPKRIGLFTALSKKPTMQIEFFRIGLNILCRLHKLRKLDYEKLSDLFD